MNPIISFFLVTAGVVGAVSFTWYWAMKKRKATLRLLAVLVGLFNLGIGYFIWYATHDFTVLVLVMGILMSQSAFILALPKIAPGIYKKLETNKKLGIKW